jgi:hypothetical protein
LFPGGLPPGFTEKRWEERDENPILLALLELLTDHPLRDQAGIPTWRRWEEARRRERAQERKEKRAERGR